MKEEEDNTGPAGAHHQYQLDQLEGLLEGLVVGQFLHEKKMDKLMEVLKTGFEKVAGIIEQGVEDTHEYQDVEKKRRKKEAMRKVLEKSVGRSVELERPKGLAEPEVENQICEIGDKMIVE